jgi:lipoprotein-releasing system permease protein
MNRATEKSAPSRPPSRLRSVLTTLWDLLVVGGRILGLLLILLVVLPIVLVPLAAAGVILVVTQVAVGAWGGHYRHLLTQRYLRRKLIPLFAAVAVALCTAMVVIVLSVMGGFLDLLRSAGHSLIGDVSISFGLGGFPHYEELIREIEALPEAEAATPLIEAFGLLKLPWDEVHGVRVLGIDGEGMDRVTGFRNTLYWTGQRMAHPDHEQARSQYAGADPVDAAMKMTLPWKTTREFVPVIPGLEVSSGNRRTSEGTYRHEPPIFGFAMTLTVLPVTQAGGIDTITPETREVLAINEYKSGIYEVDSKQVFIPFEVAQRMMRMQEEERILRGPDGRPLRDEEGNFRTAGKVPARTSWVYVKGVEGVDVDYLRQRVEEAYLKVAARHDDLPFDTRGIATWEQRQREFIGAVQNEKGLMGFLFGIISVVSVVMVGVIFYTIVTEKTRDIGVLRALGASQVGVASIFLGFGASIGLMGTLIGCAVGYLFVTSINEIHDWLGDGFGAWAVVFGGMSAGLLVGIVAVAAMFGIDAWTDRNLVSRHTLRRTGWIIGGCVAVGLVAPLAALLISRDLIARMNQDLAIVIWDRRIYFFDRIPSQVDLWELLFIAVVAVIASVVGALLPAVKAAMVDPVESLRYE